MKGMRFLLVHSFCLLVLAGLAPGDQLILHNGTVLEGTYLGGDARSVPLYRAGRQRPNVFRGGRIAD